MSRARRITGFRYVTVGLLMILAGALLAASYEGFCFVGCVLVHPYLPYGIAVAAAGVGVFVLGLYFLVTSGRPETDGAVGTPAPPPEVAPSPADLPPEGLSRKFCPVCGNLFPLDHNVCPQDGTFLRAVR